LYVGKRFEKACKSLGLKHRKTRPYTPRTNGKAALREWAYAQTYQNSEQRTAALLSFTHQYNSHRPHASLNEQLPISRARLNDNNLLMHHS